MPRKRGAVLGRRTQRLLGLWLFAVAISLPAIFLAPGATAATPAVQQVEGGEISSGTTSNVTFPGANSAGGLIVVTVYWDNNDSVSISDTRGNAYAAATARTNWYSGWSAQTFYAKNIAAGTNTVTATFASAVSSFGIVQAQEYAGIDPMDPLDASSTETGYGTSMASAPATSTGENDLLYAAGGSVGAVTAAGPGYTARLSTAGNLTMDRVAATPGTYTATADNSGGQWVMQLVAFRADSSGSQDSTPPSAPGNLAAQAVSPSQINLTWDASTDDVGVTRYQVERCQDADCTSFTLVDAVTGTNHHDMGLTAGTTYLYRVRALDAAGNTGEYSAIATATSPSVPDADPPSVPAGLAGSGASISAVDLSWMPSTDNVGVAGYRVYRNGTEVGTTTTASFHDTGLAVGTEYEYTVRAFDAAGNQSPASGPVQVSTDNDTTPPSAPADLAAQVVSSTQITLSWRQSDDNVGVAGYRIYRDGSLLKTSTVTPVQDSGLTPETTYRYTVSAFDAAGNESAQTPVAEASTPAPDNTPPSAAMTAPDPGSTVSGTVTVSATATDNVGIAEVDFLLDGVSIGVDTSAPYSVSWNTTTTSNGPHSLSARARDTAGNYGITSGVVTVSVDNSTAPPGLPAGLVAGWNFDEGSGTSTEDVTGNGNQATLRNSPSWTGGKYGSALTFDNINDFLTIPNSGTLNISGNAMTFSAWVNPLAGGGDQVVFAKFYNSSMASPYYQYALELQGGRVPVFLIGTPDGITGASMGDTLPLGQWSHVAGVFDGSRVQFYLNGTLVSSPDLAATIVQRGTPLQLGADVAPSQFLNGTLDDVRIYNRTLTGAEIRTDRDTPLEPPSSDPTGPSVAITAPAADAQVSGNVTITAIADDDVGVEGVRFFVDGTQVGPEDTTAPYGADWDSRGFSNGAHTLTARATDTAANVTVSAPVNVNAVNSDYFHNEILATGFELPTAMKFLPNGRLLVTELQGKIKVVGPPYTTPEPELFGEITNIGAFGVQQGIYDLALDPDFETNHYYYVFYTAGTPNLDRLSRFTANATNTGTVPGSEIILYEDPFGTNAEHHGGGITFANDGRILFTTGEHFDPPKAQDLTTPKGKIHRINRDGSVPTDNPFFDGDGPNWDSIWAYGLRNPFRAYYDAPTGRMFIGDVGGNVGSSNEELNLGAEGADYGWPDYEGPCPAPCTPPIYDYEHNGRDAAIVGGFVYHGTQFPSSMRGDYFFADYAQNWIRRMTFDANGNVTGVHNFEPASDELDGPAGDVVYLTEGPDGSLYYLDLGYSDITGLYGVSKLRRIRYLQSNQAPVAVASADPVSGSTPLEVSFSSAGSEDPEGEPVSYSWDFGDGAVSEAANPTHTYSQAGLYTVRLTVSDGVSSTFSTPLTITAGGSPEPTITGPADGDTFRAGDVIDFSGDAADPDDGTLPASAFRWNVDFLHDGHVHPGTAVNDVTSGSFTIPTSGHDFSGNTRYRITLTVTDSTGLSSSRTVTVWPEKVNLPFSTTPSGLTLYVDGIAKQAPFVLDTLVGFRHTIEARNQSSENESLSFDSWSDGGAQRHDISASATDRPYAASYTGAPIDDGPVAAWGFDDGAGTSAADGSGHGNAATLVNGPSWVAGQHGTALRLDGLNDHLNVPDSATLDIGGDELTLSMWISPESASGDSVVVGKYWNAGMTSPYYQYGIELRGSRPQFFVGTTDGVRSVAMDPALPLNEWSHLAIVFDGSDVQFIVNGVPTSTSPLNATITARGKPMKLGADADSGQFFTGRLDDVRIYRRALTAAEVQADMSAGVSSP
jgi:glucose/arabinose dehydrogenase/PKD repeat protein/fibronectin type 3 domain-containing protein